MDEHDSGGIPDVLLSDSRVLPRLYLTDLLCNVASDDSNQETLYYMDLRLIEPHGGDRILIHCEYGT